MFSSLISLSANLTYLLSADSFDWRYIESAIEVAFIFLEEGNRFSFNLRTDIQFVPSIVEVIVFSEGHSRWFLEQRPALALQSMLFTNTDRIANKTSTVRLFGINCNYKDLILFQFSLYRTPNDNNSYFEILLLDKFSNKLTKLKMLL